MSIDIKHLQSWIGRQETVADELTLTPMTALAATLDHGDGVFHSGDLLPELWHWLYFLPVARQSNIGEDGHPRRGGFLPPIELPSRMWAGGRLEFIRNPQAGDRVERITTIVDVSHKSGRSGELVFVTLQHEICDDNGLLIREEQDLGYRDNLKPGSPLPPVPSGLTPLWTRTINPDPVLLFRYSALTLNGHRIHYDRPYAQDVEGYPGLVVHGPLIATLLVDLFHHHMPGDRIKHFSFRALRALYDTAPFRLCGVPAEDGREVRLWAEGSDGGVCMEATIKLV
ncbi:acyl-CoA dehydrogenase [Pseudomonas sp. CG7]|uniref:FAS1-like dehydratase domain-containing protein n=1 Tax=Pseudomonas sp. CG7 TaxID=191007 RepID=UPI0020333EF4|nr:MaoC family dehydratase N-terminal domain-containing protein [Pseudomonas sp. CG7]MCM2459409.1 acyl-CoA dehydrogenase [Pseudomonas sp. CG7]